MCWVFRHWEMSQFFHDGDFRPRNGATGALGILRCAGKIIFASQKKHGTTIRIDLRRTVPIVAVLSIKMKVALKYARTRGEITPQRFPTVFIWTLWSYQSGNKRGTSFPSMHIWTMQPLRVIPRLLIVRSFQTDDSAQFFEKLARRLQNRRAIYLAPALTAPQPMMAVLIESLGIRVGHCAFD